MVRDRIGARWMGYERSTGDFVGWYALLPHEPGEYEIGYRLRREMWGRGLATEGMRALIDAAFDQLGATRDLGADDGGATTRSRAVMERCGLRTCAPSTSTSTTRSPAPKRERSSTSYAARRPRAT